MSLPDAPAAIKAEEDPDRGIEGDSIMCDV